MEVLGFVITAIVFAVSGLNHIKNSDAMSGYALPAFGNCPFAIHLSYLAGWPTGVFLLATSVGIVFQVTAALVAAAGFLALTQVIFHRDLKDPGNLKNLSLLGALLALAVV